MRIQWLCALAAALTISGAALADPVSYTFSVEAANPGISGLTSVTNGSFTFDASPGAASPLTAFALTIVDSQGAQTLDTYSYGIGDLSSYSSDFTGTPADPILSSFVFAASSFQVGLQSDGTGYFFGAETESVGELQVSEVGGSSPVAATPEPSSLWLLGTGLLGVAVLQRRRIRS